MVKVDVKVKYHKHLKIEEVLVMVLSTRKIIFEGSSTILFASCLTYTS
jgi:hypothetical protein